MSFLADLRYSARGFTRTPGIMLALVLTIALGIGSNASCMDSSGDWSHAIFPSRRRRGRVVVRAGCPAHGCRPALVRRLSVAREISATHSNGSAPPASRRATIVRGDRRRSIGRHRHARARQSAPTPTGAMASSSAISCGRPSSMPGLRFAARLIRIDGVESRVDGVAPEWLEGLYSAEPSTSGCRCARPRSRDRSRHPERSGFSGGCGLACQSTRRRPC